MNVGIDNRIDFAGSDGDRRGDFAVMPRYVQALFAETATSFTDEVTKRRLARAHDMLASPRHAHMSIMDIAHECGFSTVSHFHRMFRRRFKATPGEVRGNSGN